MSTSIQEQALLKGLAANDRKSIETIYREHYGVVQGYILKNNGYHEDARDIFQEAMVVLFEKSKSESFELTCQIRTYIYSICRRLWLKKLQQMNRYSLGVDEMEEIIGVEDELEMHEKRNADLQLMESALGKIGEPCKSLLEAYYIQKKGMQEIADSFGYTNSDNAKTQKYKCLVRLKKLFFAQYKNGN
ncbi:MAG: sigma-70 family RNA polymerase sigma factor [Chitinophagaceae bacterium]